MTGGAPVIRADPAYFAAFSEILARISQALAAHEGPPIPVHVAGGAAVHIYTGARLSRDIDASIGARVVLPVDLSATYRGPDGLSRTLYFDKQYNESSALLHEDVHDDAIPIAVPGVDPRHLDVRLFSPVDLAVSKLARFADNDQADIRALAAAGLIDAESLRARAIQALPGYVGDLRRLENSITLAVRMLNGSPPNKAGARSRPRRG